MIVKLLTEHHLEFLSLKGGCKSLSESTLVKMSNCWKYAATHILCKLSCFPVYYTMPICVMDIQFNTPVNFT